MQHKIPYQEACAVTVQNGVNMRKQEIIQWVLRLIALISFVVALLWFIEDRTYEPFLALLSGIVAIVGAHLVNNISTITAKNLKSNQGKIDIHNKTNGSVDVSDAEADKDIRIQNE